MKYQNIIYKNKKLIRVNSKQIDNIIKHYKENIGKIIYILPINANPDCIFINGFFEITIDESKSYIDYINFMNEIKFYNCGAELGYYLKYYIDEVC